MITSVIEDKKLHDFKFRVAWHLKNEFVTSKLSQKQFADKIGVRQSDISRVTRYELQMYSLDRLILMAMKVGYDIILRLE